MAKYCTRCGAELNSQTGECPVYNSSKEEPRKSPYKGGVVFLTALITLLVIGLVVFVVLNHKGINTNLKRTTISMLSSSASTSKVNREVLTTIDSSVDQTTTSEINVGNAGNVSTEQPGAGTGYSDDGGIIFPDSSTRLLTISDIEGLSKDQIQQAINEIYARNGYYFKKDNIRAFFEKYSWYSGTNSDMASVSGSFNNIEASNVALLEQYR